MQMLKAFTPVFKTMVLAARHSLGVTKPPTKTGLLYSTPFIRVGMKEEPSISI
jgi:hypothetical protein